jgi:transaldolase/glucose-6-phosphate isomerase
MNPLQQLQAAGQSVWLDYIRMDLLESGELARLIAQGEVRGVTSNPTIFQQAIANATLYDDAARPLAQAGWSDERVYEALAVDDIRAATDLFLPLYERTQGADGFVSIEVSPRLAYDGPATMAEARRLWFEVNRPNVMIKIPATEPGLPAIEQAIAEGININVTLVFSLRRYAQVMQAYLQGLERRLRAGNSLNHVASVASFFVSRVDTLVDARLDAVLREEGPKAPRAAALLGKAAIANAKLAYAQFKAFFADDRFGQLKEHGARLQRPLWASTSTKNPAYRDVVYVEELIGPHTVNTLPPATLAAFREHGLVQPTIEQGLSAARAQLEGLEQLGLSMEQVTDQLERDGVEKFAEAFEGLLGTLGTRGQGFRAELGGLQPSYQSALDRLEQSQIGPRLWGRDASLWPGQSAEIWSWLDAPKAASEALQAAAAVTEAARSRGIATLGWIAPGEDRDLPAVVEPHRKTRPEFTVAALDSLDPLAASRFADATPVQSSLFILAQSDRPPIELLAGLEPAWQRAREHLGESAGAAFGAVGAPGSGLMRLASERGFGWTQTVEPAAPGRFGALSPARLIPAQVLGVDVEQVLAGAGEMAHRSGPGVAAPRSPALSLAAYLVAAGEIGSDRLEVLADPPLLELAGWFEGLVRGSLGLKLAVTGQDGRPPSNAVACVYLRGGGERDGVVRQRVDEGTPVLVIQVRPDLGGLGAAVFRCQFAAAAAAHTLGRDPFRSGQRRWELGKSESWVEDSRRHGDLDTPHGHRLASGITVWPEKRWGKLPDDATLEQVATSLLSAAGTLGEWVLSSYPEGGPESRTQAERILTALRAANRDQPAHVSTTEPGVLQVVMAPHQDELIPGLDLTYSTVNRLLARAEFEALQGDKALAWGILLPAEIELKQLADALAAAAGRVG